MEYRGYKNVKHLLTKYETKQPGEPNPIDQDLKKEWRTKQRIRQSLIWAETLNLQGTTRQQAIHIIKHNPTLNKLCTVCSWETIILAILFYVKFSHTQKEKLSKYALAREYGLTEERYAAVVTRLAKHFQEHTFLFRC